jgi:hypothetical protein
MAPRKRARSSAAAASNASFTLSGGDPCCAAGVAALWRAGKLCDVEVLVEGRTFHAHRVVLAAGADYMAALFDAGMADSARRVIELPDMPASAFEAVLHYLYTGETECSDDCAALLALLQAAGRLQVVPLQHAAVESLRQRLTPASCVAIWREADQLTLPELVADARKVALAHFEELGDAVPPLGFEPRSFALAAE